MVDLSVLKEISRAYNAGEMSKEEFEKARKAELHFIEYGEYPEGA